MASILERLHIPLGFGLWDMSDGDKYTIDDDSTTLTPELAASDRETDEAYNKRFRQETKGNDGRSKSKFKVEKGQLHDETRSETRVETPKAKGIDER